jgi:peptidyl-prolyl cis-trans isomerase B (cyclophilin B)
MTALKRLILLCILLALPFATVNADDNKPRVRLTTTYGDIVLELDREKAPISVENFLGYVQEGFYNGTIFHRVIDGFMIQGGGFTQDFMKKPTHAPIENEADNGLENLRGTIAMARTNMPHSATAQFFINVVDNDFLNHRSPTPRGWGYAVFGKVVEGMEVVDKIRKTPTGSGGPFPKDVPQPPIVIENAVLEGAMPPTAPGNLGVQVQ